MIGAELGIEKSRLGTYYWVKWLGGTIDHQPATGSMGTLYVSNNKGDITFRIDGSMAFSLYASTWNVHVMQRGKFVYLRAFPQGSLKCGKPMHEALLEITPRSGDE